MKNSVENFISPETFAVARYPDSTNNFFAVFPRSIVNLRQSKLQNLLPEASSLRLEVFLPRPFHNFYFRFLSRSRGQDRVTVLLVNQISLRILHRGHFSLVGKHWQLLELSDYI